MTFIEYIFKYNIQLIINKNTENREGIPYHGKRFIFMLTFYFQILLSGFEFASTCSTNELNFSKIIVKRIS